MKKEFVFLLVASLAQIVTANDEWMEECKNQSANIQIHSADGNWKNFSSDETSNKYFWIDRTFTCTADPDHFALVRINHKMDFPSDTKTITCGSRRKWVYKDEVVLNVGCYTGPIEEWRKECNNQSEKIVIHSADGNWTNLSSDLTTHQQYEVYRKFTCTADPGHFAFVQINDQMDSPSDTKSIGCGKERKWLHKGEVVVAVGCYTGPRENWIQKPEEEERIRNWMGEHHGAKEDQKDWTWGSTQYKQQEEMQRMASEIQKLLVNTDNIVRKQVAVLPADYVNAFRETQALSEDNYYMRTAFVGFGDDNSVLEFTNYVIFVFRGGFPDRSKPDAEEGISRYFQDDFNSTERHDGIQLLADRHFAFVQINHKMDFPSDTKTITCGSRLKWVYKGEVVLNVGCYTGTRADLIQKSEEEERIRNWMGEHHGVKGDQKDWTRGSTQYKQQEKMQRMASEIYKLLVNTDDIIRKQVAVLPVDYVNAGLEPEYWAWDNYYMRTGFVGFGEDNSVLEFANYVVFVFRVITFKMVSMG
ncbi:unnamed protein product, partial [Mesorhabditis belari]|uniref:Uncharacterized protein n=1 Tax=Mesorhabditis belari TaxID=2138241 RepID=A0AAF3EJD7_9BILA